MNKKTSKKELVFEHNLINEMEDAFNVKDEPRMTSVILKAMRVFLDNPSFSRWFLEDISLVCVVIPIHEPEHEYELKDNKLKYVLDELSAASVEPKMRKRLVENTKRFILYLEGKEYAPSH